MSSVGWLIGSGYNSANAAGAAISVISGLISNTQLNGAGETDVKAELSTILGTTLEKVFGKINETVSNVLNPGVGKKDNALIEGMFANGAFLDNKINQYLVVAAMKSWSTTGAYGRGYAVLSNDGDTYGYSDEASCTAIGNEAMIWYKNTCVGFGTYANLLPGTTTITYTGFLDAGMITELKKYVPDLRLAIINSWECYVDPNRQNPETDPV
ncbi:hypothetical protein VE00_02437 [Pseudogymnoascus sp. WSF 3629]|nr:hypothetical protein VE00_02437 [Pseudogymnoascus sp. WSF 3629]